MDGHITGTITRISELRTTQKGVALKQLFLKKENGDYIYPTVLGKNVSMLDGHKPGDLVSIEFDIKGSAEKYNNIVIQAIQKLN